MFYYSFYSLLVNFRYKVTVKWGKKSNNRTISSTEIGCLDLFNAPPAMLQGFCPSPS